MAKKKYGDWGVVKSHAEGGQAHIFLVKKSEAKTEKLYVLKRLKNRNRISRFISEIKAATKLSHPNIVQVIDSDYENDPPFLVMNYYSKGNLSAVHALDLNLLQKLELFHSICSGIAHAHENGVIHRDLKPENILLTDDLTPVVSDFGICFLTENGERFTITDEVVGPYNYMAPELEDGRVTEVRETCDVYSLGKILYWLLADRIFSREKHRLSEFNLTTHQSSPNYYIINELLDKTIVAGQTERIANAKELLNELEVVMNRIESKGHVTDFKAPQPCIYCAKGHYKIAATAKSGEGHLTDVRNFGFNTVGNPSWHVLVCNYCGNVQIFRPDYTDDPNVWK